LQLAVQFLDFLERKAPEGIFAEDDQLLEFLGLPQRLTKLARIAS